MKNFAYLLPKDLKEASRLLRREPERSVLYAGGTDVLGLMKDHVVEPDRVVNLKSLPGLDEISYAPGEGLRIGALVKVADLAENEVVRKRFAVLAEAAESVASPQLRNMGTVGGNLCQRPRCWYFRGNFHCLRKGGDVCFAVDGENKFHCVIGGGPCFIVHPSDLAVALLALEARFVIFDGKKSRAVPAAEFFVLPQDDVLHENILGPGEILTEVRVPDLPEGARSGYLKFTERAVWDFAIVSVAAVLQPDGSKIGRGRIAFGGVAPVPWQEKGLNTGLTGLEATEEAFRGLAEKALADASPLEQNAYKILLARNLLKRLLMRLAG